MFSKLFFPTRLLCGVALGMGLAHAALAADDIACSTAVPTPQKVSRTVIDYNGNPQTYTFWTAQDYCYGDAQDWYEPAPTQGRLVQRADLWYPTSDINVVRPLIIWTHPTGMTEDFRAAKNAPYEESTIFQSVLVPAMQAGYAVASLQFRHPTASYDPAHPTDLPGNTDIRDAVQYLKYHADELHIDPANVFLVGQSRGTLNMLWAIRPDAAASVPGKPWRAESSTVRAVWDYQAQSCYKKAKVKKTFILPEDYSAYVNDPDNYNLPDSYDAGCALEDVQAATSGATLPPIRVMYDEEPISHGSVTLQHWCSDNSDTNCRAQYPRPGTVWADYFDLHDANFGVALSAAYQAKGSGDVACHGVAKKYDHKSGPYNGYANFTHFFDLYHFPSALPTGYVPDCPVVAHPTGE
ncbi:hypothetical protein LRH25_02385 [Ideonella azotifigens]|uniref:BD-FAE-like domain-containing protein n=1 Tax=Ideonella azotifigens TaxID=513160 RepID=A0ABN1KKQ6_9BURK|nr:hypothetical protein [Ideonella azotifigens]MCD2339183.1 hypothetical protein [Ideonella azotifigens]